MEARAMQPGVDHARVWGTFTVVCVLLAALLEPLRSMGLRACFSIAVGLPRCLVRWVLRLLPWVLLLVVVLLLLLLCILAWRICTYKPPPGLALHHNVIPTTDFDHKQWTMAYSSSVVAQLPHHPRLKELPAVGSLVAWPVQQAVMDALQGVGPLAQLLGQEVQQQPALAVAAQAPLEDLLSQPDVCRCIALGPPEVPIVLVGTAHVSKASAEYTREAILALEPDLVVVELCEGRVPLLMADASDPGPRPSLMESLRSALGGRGKGTGLLQVLLSSFLQGAADQVGSQPGAEFAAARRAVVELAAAQQEHSIWMATEAPPPPPRQRRSQQQQQQRSQAHQQQLEEEGLSGSAAGLVSVEGAEAASSHLPHALGSTEGEEQGQQDVWGSGAGGVAEGGPGVGSEEEGSDEEADEHMLQIWGVPLSTFPPEPPSSNEHTAAAASGDACAGGTLQPSPSSQHQEQEGMAEATAAPREAADAAAGVLATQLPAASSSNREAGEGTPPRALPGITLALADRPLADTLAATWGALTPWRRLMFIGTLLRALLSGKLDEDLIKDLLEEEDMLTNLLKEFNLTYPELLLPLVHDRNWYLAVRIWRYARLTHRPLVAVLGKAHLQGVVHALLYLSIIALRVVERQQLLLAEAGAVRPEEADAQAGQD